MQSLQRVRPTNEQLKLLTRPQLGTMIIRGAAGSGKTTTSLLMLNLSMGYLIDRFSMRGIDSKINIRVFTFNKTLAGYIDELVKHEVSLLESTSIVEVEVTTLFKYFRERIEAKPSIISLSEQSNKISTFCFSIPLERTFIVDEVDYLLGRLEKDKLEDYIDMERTGRGQVPRVDKVLRRKILDEVVYPYIKYKEDVGVLDWNDLSIEFSKNKYDSIHIAIIDEAQDLSANQIKAITRQLEEDNFTTIVLDTNQRIYKRGFTWKEVGIDASKTRYARLEFNYRNTFEIANFASQLIYSSGITCDDDGTFPKLTSIERHGELPIVIKGKFSKQLDYTLDYINKNIDLSKSSVGFLHAKGGRWFSTISERLSAEKKTFDCISSKREWNEKDTNISLSTIHSAKGLEFDYVFILGLEDSHFPVSSEDSQDNDYTSFIKLISMGITRAKKKVILGYKEDSKPFFISLLKKGTFIEVLV